MSSASKDEIGKPAENHKQPEDLTQKETQPPKKPQDIQNVPHPPPECQQNTHTKQGTATPVACRA